jgi:CRP/FNR family transcriptional regulator, cyclic AMP receptor protein
MQDQFIALEGSSMSLRDMLKTVELFIGLDDQQLDHLAEISHEKRFNTGDLIFAQGDDGDKLYIIREGQVCIQVDRQGDSAQTQLYLGQGQILGEMALLDHGKRSASARCTVDKTLIQEINRPAFTALCERDKALGYIVMRNLAIDLSFKLRHRNLDPGAS